MRRMGVEVIRVVSSLAMSPLFLSSGTSLSGYLSVMGTSSNGGVTGIMKLIFFTSAEGAGYFAHHRKVCPGSKLSSAGLLALLLDKYVPSESLSIKYFFLSAVT